MADVVKPETVETRDAGLVTTRPKPEKRKNAKERAKAKFNKAGNEKTAEDGTTPMTATAKSEADLKKAERKAATKVAAKTAKAERKAKRTAAKAA